MRCTSFFLLSVFSHLLAIAIIWHFSNLPKRSLEPVLWLEWNENSPPKGNSAGINKGNVGAGKAKQRFHTGNKLQLRPDGWNSLNYESAGPGIHSASDSASLTDALHTDSNSLIAFDQLAVRIDSQLDYPDLLVENSVEGTATLDLYFNAEGDLDEARSQFTGSHRTIRGIFIKAARKGILSWYLSDSFRLKKEQFRNQHFHSDFSLSVVTGQGEHIEKLGTEYFFHRRRFKDYCVRPTNPPGLSLDGSCLAIKAYGAIRDLLSEKRRMQFEELQDEMDFWDHKGISGLSAEILETRSSSGSS